MQTGKMRFSISCWILVTTISITTTTVIYNSVTEECCDGVRYQSPDEVYSYCCGDQMISDYDNYTCCNGIVYIRPNYDNWRCCNSELIDAESTACVDDGAVDIPDEAINSNQRSVCANYTVNLYVFYNDNDHLCCDGNIVDKPTESSKCCGDNAYDPLYGLCCYNSYVITDFEETVDHLACCGNTYYNFLTQKCCNDVPVDKGNITYGHCCGESIYDDSNSICCNDTIIGVDNPKEWSCCGQHLYYKKTQVCCENGLTDNLEGNEEAFCCGNEVIFDNRKKCCKNKVYDLDDGRDICLINEFCAFYKPAEQICCSDGIVTITSQDATAKRSRCCNREKNFNQFKFL